MNLKRILKAAAMTGAALAMLTAFASATELKIGVGIVHADGGLRLRASASTDSEILATAANNDTAVVIRKTDDGWYLVDYNLKIGYMSAEFVEFKAVESVDLGTGKVNCPLVNVRSAPSTGGDLVKQLSEGYLVNIIGLNQGWYKVTFGEENELVGYVRSDLLELTTAPEENADGTEAAAAAVAVAAAPTSKGVELATYAQNFIGTPYSWGGTSPSGFDCSGFCQYVYKQYGYSLYRTADSQMKNGTVVSQAELQPGDLVFFGNTYYSSETATHVGIYIGDGQFVHAASGGVKITDLNSDYYAPRYVGARRIL